MSDKSERMLTMKRMNTRLLAMLLALVLVFTSLPATALAATTGSSDDNWGKLSVEDVTDELTDADRKSMFEENMDTDKVSESELPDPDELVRVIVELDTDSLLDVRDRVDSAMSMMDFQRTQAAQDQLSEISTMEADVKSAIAAEGIEPEYVFSYAAIISGFSAEVPYGDIEAIEAVDGVARVVLCETYYPDVMGDATLGEALSPAEVAAYSNNTDYKGEGMLIGIVDTGLDVNHEAFANAPAVQKLQKAALEKLLYTTEEVDGKTKVTAYSYAALWYAQNNSTSSQLNLLTADMLYKSGKVPFAFDYADKDADVVPSAEAVTNYGNDHGTHVAGIAAGKTVDSDGNVTFSGQAPEAQLAIFKVFSDSTSGASTDNILAALNDALLLDVDVINMSLGSGGGFSREEDTSAVTKYYDLVKSAGILLDVSAGNAYSSSRGGAQGDYASTSDPDTGIIGSPSSYDASLSVASVDTAAAAAFRTDAGRVPYNDVTGHDFASLLLGGETSKTLEYVVVGGSGDKSDYEGLDVTGKVALVQRGGLSFEQKQINAADAGAVACVIYNNLDGYLLNMSVTDYRIPTVSISHANGVAMAEQENKTLTVSSEDKGTVTMSDFSSWGPLPSLELKPEITAPGGDIYSSLPFAQYGYMSGTSMAAPYMSGVSAAMKQYLNKIAAGLSDKEKQVLANRILMSTADILYEDSGVAYSPRKQGAGMVDLSAATSTPAYLYVRDSERTKIELGDDANRTGIYDLSFVLKNMTAVARSYAVDAQVQTETASDAGYILQQGHALSPDVTISVSGGTLDGNTVTVSGNGEATINVKVRLSDSDKEYLAKFPNGIYVEGFVELTNDDDPSLSVPFLGFYGDWSEAPILEDSDIYNDASTKMFQTAPTGVYAMMYLFPLGTYPFKVPEGWPEPGTSADRISVDLGGGNGMGNLYYLQAGMLRGAKTAMGTIVDADTGAVYKQWSEMNVRKAMYNSSTGKIRAGLIGEAWPALTGKEIVLIPSNTHMTYTVTAYVDGVNAQNNKNNTYSFNFTSDGEMPYILDRDNLRFRKGDDGRVYLDVTLADNFALAGATLYSAVEKRNNSGKLEISTGSNYYEGIYPAVKDDGTVPGPYEEFTYTFDVTDFYKTLTKGCFYVVAYDYAMNQCAFRVRLPEQAVTGISLDKTSLTLPLNGHDTLTATVTPDDATDQHLTWTSSNEDVVEVRSGIVAAKSTGTATITVSSTVWPDIMATCDVTVTDEVGPAVSIEEMKLTRTAVSMVEGGTNTDVRLYAYAPFYATDLTLEWSSSDTKVVTVEPNGPEGEYFTSYAKLTAVGAGTAIVTATAKATGATAEVEVTVAKASTTGSFQIVGDTLVAYSGGESNVVVPDGVRVIGEQAFKGNAGVISVTLPTGVEEINYRAFYGCSNLKSVNLPDSLKTIGEGAFQGCTSLASVNCDTVLPASVTSVGKNAFSNCKALAGDLVLGDALTELGESAFYGCAELTSVTMSDSFNGLNAAGGQFNGCTKLQRAVLSAALKELPARTFFACGLSELPDLKNVASIGQACFQRNNAMTAVTIPETVTYLAGNAFAYNTGLKEVTILGTPEMGSGSFSKDTALEKFTAPKLTYIGVSAFDGDTALTEFVVPDNLTFIGDKAFQNCKNLTKLIFPSTYKAPTLTLGIQLFLKCTKFTGIVVEDGASIRLDDAGVLYTADGKTLIAATDSFKATSYTVADGVETISPSAFYSKTSLTTITLPASMRSIGDKAFYGCTGLTAITFPDGMSSLGVNAFDGCTKLATVGFGKSLTAVPAYAFNKCAALKTADLPASVTCIGDHAFNSCSSLTSVTFPDGLTEVAKYAFNGCSKLKKAILPASVTMLGDYAFYGCSALTDVDCGSATVIPTRAFYGVKALKNLAMSDNVTEIGDYAFYNCNVLTDFGWPSKLERVGKNAFYCCRMLTDFDFTGTKLTDIGNYGFYQCYEARTLEFPETLERIGSYAFAYLNFNKTAYITEVTLPASLTSIAKNAFDKANSLKSISVAEGNKTYTSSDGILLLRETGDIYIWPADNEITEFTIPSTMTAIPDKMLQNNKTIKKLYIPSTVTTIGAYAFQGSALEEVYFETSANGLTIDDYAFQGCKSLKVLSLPYGLTATGSYAFSGTGLEELNLPDTLTTMGSNALSENASLKKVKLPASLTAIPERGFTNCEALEEITSPASVTNWGAGVSTSAFLGCTSLKNVYVDNRSLSFKSVDGVLFDYTGKTLVFYPAGRDAEQYVIPEGTVRVGAHAFRGNTYLKKVTYPSTLVRIGNHAFFGCSNLKDYYFTGMTAPLLETTASTTGPVANLALYCNFVGIWADYEIGVGYVYNDFGLNLYYPEGATGYTAYVWEKYFNTEKGSVTVMESSYFTPIDLTVTETGKHNAALTWTAAKQADLESVTYTVERSLAHKVSDGEQDTWVYDGFETLAEGLTECAYTDPTTLNIGCTYAYRVTTFAGTKTGPGAIATLYIDASADDPDEQAVLEIIKKIEALKPIDLLTAADEQRVRELLAEYNALTDAQKELVFNYQTLLDAIEQVGHNPKRTNVKDATCTESGYTGDLVCEVCGEVLETGSVIDPLGHSYGEPSWTWTEDGTAATATFTCGNDASHTEVLDGDITSEITKEAACGVAGEETFTATVTFAGKTYTDSKVLATAALDHDPEVRNAKDATCTEDGYTGDTVCKRCGETLATGSAIPALGHDTEVKNAKAATCTEAGYTGDTVCKRCGQTVATGSSIPATGHHYGSDGKCKDCGEKQTATPATGDTFDVAMTTLVLMTSAVLAAALWFSMRKRSK